MIMDTIQAYRIYVSGVASTFGQLDDALAYARAEAFHNRIENIAFASVSMDLSEYEREIAEQEEQR